MTASQSQPGSDAPSALPLTDEPDYRGDMQLPEGLTCGDCRSQRRCFGLGFAIPGQASCDFWPNRFRPLSSEPRPSDGSETTKTGST